MNPLRILLVDDSSAIRNALRSLLSSREELSVCGEASDGQEAIDLARTLRPDAILMDISMPRMDGLEATRRIRADLPDTKVIIVSQNDPAIVRLQAKQAGAHAYVGKSDLARDIFPAFEALFPPRNGYGGSSPPPASLASLSQSQSSPGQGHWLIGGEMAERMRSMDWAQTPLGPAPSWSPALRMMVNFLLANRFPQLLWWGPQFVSLYNDAYIPVLGAKHPWALGKTGDEVWSEIWNVLKPLVEAPFSGGPATWIEDIPLELKRRGFTEETHFTIAYSAVPDETAPGGIGGVLATVHEITEKVVSERRIQALRDIGAGSVEPKSAEEACELAARALSAHPADIPFVAFYLLDDKGQPRLASAAGFESVQAAAVEKDVSCLAAAAWPFAKLIETQETQVLMHLKDTLATVPRGPWSDPPDAAALVPVRSTGPHKLAGLMVAGLSSRLEFDEQYKNFLELVSTQVATNIANARAYEEARKRADALAEIDRAKTTFFSNVSHEFRTPLTLMLNPVEDLLARDTSGLPVATRNQLEMVRRNGNRMLRLVNTLLDFSRIEAGRVQAFYQPTDLAALTADLASGFRSATEAAGLKFFIDCPPLAEPVYVDHDMWEKIVLNLISNAFKFTFDGEIAVTLKRSGDHVELAVRDTGIGVSAEELPKLFDRFHRVENARGRTHEGSGIGLALANELVKLHGGSLRAESAPGKGSRFIVRIPTGSAHLPPDRLGTRTQISPPSRTNSFVEEALRWLPKAPQTSSTEFPASASGPAVSQPQAPSLPGRSRVLVADDNADMREYLTRLLEGKHDVEVVADGKAALDAATREPPDLILSDVMMPQMDGVTLLRELRARPSLRETPVILLSARAGEESRIEGIETGADDYLVKPFSAHELSARIETHLKLARVRREAQLAIHEKERQLQSINDRLNAIVDTTPECVKVVAADGTLLHMNASGLSMIGAACMEAVVGQSVYALIVSEDREKYRAFNESVCLQGFRGSLEFAIEGLRGERRHMETHAAPLANPDGTFSQLAVTRDITERKKAEETLRRNRDRFDMVTEASQVGFWFCDLPFDKLDWDHRVKAHFGLSPDENVTIQTFYERLHPDDREPTRKAIERSIADKTLYNIEYRTVSPAGQQRWIRAIGRCFYDAFGHPQRFDGLTLDVSDVKNAEERDRQRSAQALAAEAKFRAIFDQTSVFAGIATLDGTLIDANRRSLEVCGYSTDQVAGLPFWEAPWWRSFKESRDKIREATPKVAQGIPFTETLRYSWADGSEHIVDFGLYPIFDGAGKVIFLHPTGVDITELKRAEANYRQLAETLDAEVRARTGELQKQNLEVLRQSELLREFSHRLLQVQDDERRRIARELHDSSGQILTALSMTLATISRQANTGAAGLAQEAEDGMKLVQQLSQEIRTMSYLLHPPLLDETGVVGALQWYVQGFNARSDIAMDLAIDKQIGRLPAEMELVIFRIVQEALTNVHRHAGAKTGAIRVSRAGSAVLLEIEDHGQGMSAQKLMEIEIKGFGVGLPGMRERVRQLHGKFEIRSGPGGTTISVTLPLSETPIAPGVRPPVTAQIS